MYYYKCHSFASSTAPCLSLLQIIISSTQRVFHPSAAAVSTRRNFSI